MDRADYLKKYNNVRAEVEDAVRFAKLQIEDMKREITKKHNIKNERIEQLEGTIKKLEIDLEEAQKEAERKAVSYAEEEAYYMSEKDIGYYYGSRSAAERSIYEHKLEEYTYEIVAPVRKKLKLVREELSTEIKKEIDENITKNTNTIIEKAKLGLCANLKSDFDIDTIGFVDFERLVNMERAHAQKYINWITGELVGQYKEEDSQKFVEEYNEIYKTDKDVAEVISGQEGFIDKYVQSITDISNPDTLDFLQSINYDGDFPTEEMAEKYKLESTIRTQQTQIKSYEFKVKEQEAKIEKQKEDIIEYRDKLTEQENLVEQQEKSLADKDNIIAKKDKEISELKAKEQKDNARIKELMESNKSQSETIEKQNEQIRKNEESQSLEIQMLQAQIRKLEREKEELSKENKELKIQVSKQDQIIKADSKIIESLRNAVSVIQNKLQKSSEMLADATEFIKQIHNKSEKNKEIAIKEKSKGIFKRIKEAIFPSKKEEDNIALQSEKLQELCIDSYNTSQSYYENIMSDIDETRGYQIPDSVMDDRDRKIRDAKSSGEAPTFSDVNMNRD